MNVMTELLPTKTGAPLTRNKTLLSWVNQLQELCQPESVHWCDGSQEEYDRLCQQMVQAGTFIRLNPEKIFMPRKRGSTRDENCDRMNGSPRVGRTPESDLVR